MKTAAARYQFYSRLNQGIIDALIFGISFCLAYEIRFASRVPAASEYQMWLLVAPVVVAQLTVTTLFGVYRLVWRYISLTDTMLIARSQTAYSSILLGVCLFAPERWALLRIPRGIVLIQYLLALVATLGVRALRRVTYEWSVGNSSAKQGATRVVLVGAGHAGVLVAKELVSRPGIAPVGFLDDDPQVIGMQICGLQVLGPVDGLPQVVQEYRVEEVIICVAREEQTLLRRVWALCEALSVRIRIVPTLDEILHGRVNISAFRDVEMHDLMGRARAEVVFDEETAKGYRGKRILITGAGGSIGSELAIQLAELHPQGLVLLDKDENGLHDACVRIQATGEGRVIHPVVTDLRFPDRIERVFSNFRPEVVFHAAAHKHVPLMEVNLCEAILNNVVGTRNLVERSLEYSVARFVLISTDKAVRPSSIMGATKRVCEMIIQTQSRARAGNFCCVRFGNVLGSRGSVVPLFQRQIARGEPVRITHADVRRFLMTIPEAVSLLVQAGALGVSGETFILDMGAPVLIRDLANRLIERCGLRPGRDIPIEITQLRPGEKLTEELFDAATERLLPTKIPRINVIQSPSFDASKFACAVAALEQAAHNDCRQDIQRIFRELNIGYCGEDTPGMAAPAEQPVYATQGPRVLDARAAQHA